MPVPAPSLCLFSFAFPSINLADLLPSIALPSIEIPTFTLPTPPCLLDLF